MTAAELSSAGRWDVIVGDPYRNLPPLDPFMIESTLPRSGSNPVTGTATTPPSSSTLNPINGHEYNVLANDDLQYACIFPLGDKMRDCDAVGEGVGCDCDQLEMVEFAQNPLCQQGQTYGSLQTAAKAYPGIRQLDVARRVGANAIVASICPKVVEPADPSNPSYGYNPATAAVLRRLREPLSGNCLSRQLEPRDADGRLFCDVIEAVPSGGGSCARERGSDRSDTRSERPELVEAVESELARQGRCGGELGVPCSTICLSTIEQLRGDALERCRNDPSFSGGGYCYVQPDAGVGNPELVASCPAGQRQLLRFGSTVPEPGSSWLLVCDGGLQEQ